MYIVVFEARAGYPCEQGIPVKSPFRRFYGTGLCVRVAFANGVREPFANTFVRRSFAVASGGVTVRAAFVFVRRSFAVDACTNRMFANRS